MKMTLLTMVQRILSAMNSDEVNSISDTTESLQVAYAIRDTYEYLISEANLTEHYKVFQLDASGDNDLPVSMTIPDGLDNVLWIKYNKIEATETIPKWEGVTYLEPHDFLERVMSLDTSEDNVGSYVLEDITYNFENDKGPEYYTSINDRTIIFDSYDSAVDTTLQSSKTMAYGLSFPVFTIDDDFIPDLDAQQFPLLYNEAKALCFAEIKQTAHAKAEKHARRGWVQLQRTRNDGRRNIPYRDTLANYGRK